MKAISILSALVFAHAALAQATDSSSSAAVLTTTSASVDTATSTAVPSSTPVPTSSNPGSSSADAPSSAAPSTTGTKKGSKSSSGAPTSTSIADNAAPTGGSSIWEDGTKTMTSTDGNPLMPAGVSAACSTYLSKMNKDTQLASCLTSLVTILGPYTTSGSGSPSGADKAMANLCGSNACNASVMRSALNDFADACRDDFASSDVVLKNYDMMYSLTPLKSALCTKDPNTQSYCVLNAGSSSNTKRSASNIMYARDHLVNTYVKRGSSQTVFVPNTDTYRNSNLMFMFNSPDMSSNDLCTECTKQIMSKYVAFESSTPHALGVAASPLLGGQVALWKSMQDKCPASYMSSVANAAGSPDVSSGASAVATGSTVTAFAGALAALVALI
ncbi:hypothetical protein RhiJN_28836 [Ceratobasidium sp. AG-Ba]|nr:hypothetical protein RhiJN_28836 [Ceratobasidium sp. AG-Ba]